MRKGTGKLAMSSQDRWSLVPELIEHKLPPGVEPGLLLTSHFTVPAATDVAKEYILIRKMVILVYNLCER